MSRVEENAAKREMQKITKIINKLSPQQKKVIDIVAKERAQAIAGKYVSEIKQIIENCTCSVLYDAGLNARDLMVKINILMIEESLYIEKEGIEMDKKLTREMIVNSARKHGLSADGRRKIAKELKSTYSTVTTYVSRWKITEADLNKPVVKVQPKEVIEEDPDMQEVMERVSDILDEGEEKEVENKEVEKVFVEADKVAEESELKCTGKTIKQATKDVQAIQQEDSLEVLSINLKGKNGTYRACLEGVELTNMGSIISFQNEQQVDEWANEVKRVFERIKA